MAIDRSEFMITRSSIAFEDFLGSSIAPQVCHPGTAQSNDQKLIVQILQNDNSENTESNIQQLILCSSDPLQSQLDLSQLSVVNTARETLGN